MRYTVARLSADPVMTFHVEMSYVELLWFYWQFWIILLTRVVTQNGHKFSKILLHLEF